MQTDIAIVGHGVVGLTLALQLAQQDFHVTLLGDAEPPRAPEALSSQVYAIHLGNEKLLRALNAWSDHPLDATAFFHMHVWDSETGSPLDFDAQAMHLDHLGHFVSVPRLRERLWQQVKATENIAVHCPVRTQAIVNNETACHIETDQGIVPSDLIVAADGANSWVREQCGIDMQRWPCNQRALTAIVQSEMPHQQIARQAFLPTGPLGLLPVDKHDKQVMVWSMDASMIDDYRSWESVVLNQRIQSALGSRLGTMQVQSPVHHFPLRVQHAKQYAAGRVVLVGDAAHSIHPLAGQGANLGLMDSQALCQVLCEAHDAKMAFSDSRVLARYQRLRRPANQRMLLACLALQQGFTNNAWPLQAMRMLGMQSLQRIPWGKMAMLREALGCVNSPQVN